MAMTPTRRGVKDALRAHLPPEVYFGLRDMVRAPRRWLGSLHGAERRRGRIVGAVRAGHGSVVQRGPFKGMHYLRQVSWGDDLAPKLLGCYEAELHGPFEQLLQQRYERVINVGCAEGYYAVGLAMRLPSAQVWAFDIDAHAQYLCRRLAARNGVGSRVHVGGDCGPALLNQLTAGDGRALLVVDCEGCEPAVLRPDLVPGLDHTDMVVELHDFLDPTISTTIIGRFPGHELTLVNSMEHDPARYAPPWLSAEDRVDAVSEHRPAGMQWAVLRAPGRRGDTAPGRP